MLTQLVLSSDLMLARPALQWDPMLAAMALELARTLDLELAEMLFVLVHWLDPMSERLEHL